METLTFAKRPKHMPSIVTDFRLSEHTKTTAEETIAKLDQKLASPESALTNKNASERSVAPKKVFRQAQVDTMIRTQMLAIPGSKSTSRLHNIQGGSNFVKRQTFASDESPLV